MNKMELLLHEWDFCHDKEDWFPPLAQALEGVTAEQAKWRPEGEAANTIWETVRHLIFYKERLLNRLRGEEPQYPEGLTNDDTFASTQEEEGAWQETAAHLAKVHHSIREVLAGLKEDDFERANPKTPLGLQVTSLIMHDAYHTGQIVLVRKLQGSWPSSRSFE
jgi:hypothetical protein